MGQLGWRDTATGRERPFEDWLAEAEAYGTALGMPYEVLFGIYEQLTKKDRPDGITVTQLNGCARRVHLERGLDYYATPMDNYAAFRGTLAHGLVEKFLPKGAIVEERYYRWHKGVELSGQLDSWKIMNAPTETSRLWHDWLRAMENWEREGADPAVEPIRPTLPKGARLLIRDWKTKHELPSYPYLALKYQQQGNIYAWLLRWPDPGALDIEFVFISMEGVKTMALLNGGTYSNGRAKPVQFWTQGELEQFLDDRLLTLAVTRQMDRPLPYDRVPTDDLWNCQWCPARDLCYRLAAQEARDAWVKGETVDRLPPRDRVAEKAKK